MLFSLAICIAAACLAPTTIGDYSISPETKGWAVQDITDESYTILITNLYSHSTIQVQAIPTPFTFIDNVSVFRPVPPELWQYITVTPEELNLGFGESGSFTVHVAFPDLAEMYNHTWEYRILMNDTNPYNYEAGGPSLTQKMHILRLYLPKTKPIVVAETPFYIYPFMIVFALIFLGGIVIYLKKRSVPLALRDHDSKGSEWAGMDIYTAEIKGQVPVMQTPVVQSQPSVAQIQTVIRQPVRSPVADSVVEPLREPARVPIREPVRAPVYKDVDELEQMTTSPDKDRERRDRKNARARERHALRKQSELRQPITKQKPKAVPIK